MLCVGLMLQVDVLGWCRLVAGVWQHCGSIDWGGVGVYGLAAAHQVYGLAALRHRAISMPLIVGRRSCSSSSVLQCAGGGSELAESGVPVSGSHRILPSMILKRAARASTIEPARASLASEEQKRRRGCLYGSLRPLQHKILQFGNRSRNDDETGRWQRSPERHE